MLRLLAFFPEFILPDGQMLGYNIYEHHAAGRSAFYAKNNKLWVYFTGYFRFAESSPGPPDNISFNR